MISVIRYTLLTALRDWLFIGLLASIGLAYGLSLFTGSTALSEQQHMTLALFAGSSRLVLVVGMIVFVCFHVRRAFDHREIEAILSKPLSRTEFVIGYWLGFALLTLVMVIPVAIMCLQFTQVNLAGLAMWSASLVMEVILVLAFALTAALVLSSAVSAVMASFAFYLLSRLMGFFVAAFQSQESLLGRGTIGEYSTPILNAIASVIPRLDLYTKSEWLIYGLAKQADLWVFSVQSLVFVLLLLAMAVFDLKRKQF